MIFFYVLINKEKEEKTGSSKWHYGESDYSIHTRHCFQYDCLLGPGRIAILHWNNSYFVIISKMEWWIENLSITICTELESFVKFNYRCTLSFVHVTELHGGKSIIIKFIREDEYHILFRAVYKVSLSQIIHAWWKESQLFYFLDTIQTKFMLRRDR